MSKEIKLKSNTSTGQVYIGNKCLHEDDKGYYTISTSVFMKKKIQFKQYINDAEEIESINKFCRN